MIMCPMHQIYVPFKEEDGHWFLMVICVHQQKIYKLDSYPQLEKITERERKMKNVVL